MKSVSMFSFFFVSAVVLSGCGKSSPESSKNVPSAPTSATAEVKVAPVEVKVEPIVFESDSKLGLALGMMGQGDALLKKKLGTSVGKPIEIKSMFVWSIDSSEWEKGGQLHLINDDSMGRSYRITCSISSESGDKFMETKQRRSVAVKGILKDYSSSEGLTIDPCTATWESTVKN